MIWSTFYPLSMPPRFLLYLMVIMTFCKPLQSRQYLPRGLHPIVCCITMYVLTFMIPLNVFSSFFWVPKRKQPKYITLVGERLFLYITLMSLLSILLYSVVIHTCIISEKVPKKLHKSDTHVARCTA